jgi:hypothetical protein
MPHTGIVYFAVTFFLALAALLNWKHRRDVVAARLNRGLRGYVAGTSTVQLPPPQAAHGERLIPA